MVQGRPAVRGLHPEHSPRSRVQEDFWEKGRHFAVRWNVDGDFIRDWIVMLEIRFEMVTAWLTWVFHRAAPRLADMVQLTARSWANLLLIQHQQAADMVWTGAVDYCSSLENRELWKPRWLCDRGRL